MYGVTIVIPVYNTEKYLDKAIDSCVNQTYRNIEIIIVNDGSTDDSLIIAKGYEDKYDFVSVITTKNRGLSEARNTGLKVAKGRYIYFLDSDDWIEPETIELCYNLANENDLDIVLFDSKVEVDDTIDFINKIDYNYCKRDKIVESNVLYTGREFVEIYKDKKALFVQAWLVFIKTISVKNDIRFLPNAYYEDVAFHYSCMMLADRIMYIPKAFHVRLYRSGSIMTTSLNIRKICSVYEITIEMISSFMKLEKHNDNFWLQYLIRRIRSLFRTVLGKVTRKDINLLKGYSQKIIRLQEDCISLYYKALNLSGAKISNVRKLLEFTEEIINPFGWISDRMIAFINEIVPDREYNIHNILSNLPLNKKRKIGIYGSGKHADYLISMYKKSVGNINADLVFIDSYKKSFSETYNNYNIINVDDLYSTDITEIVILSYFYEDEMYENIVSRYGNKYKIHRIYNGDKEAIDSTVYLEIYNRLLKLYDNGRKKILLINTPEHTNIGDHIITLAVMKFFKEFMADYVIVEVSNKMYKERSKEVIYRTNVNDIIVITGGGFLGSLWPYSGLNVYEIIRDFSENKIVILPQSIYFEDNKEGERQKNLAYELFMQHTDLTVCYRESLSYERSETLFDGQVQSYLMPDMALTLNYSRDQGYREGILMCLRHDKESILTDDAKLSLKEHFLGLNEKVNETSMHWHSGIKPSQREEVITEKINEIKMYKLVITDALHCLISCAISGTPCIALNNISRKIEGIYKTWMKDLNYIRFIDSYKEIYEIDLSGWDELYKNNYYNMSFNNFLKKLADLIRVNN